MLSLFTDHTVKLACAAKGVNISFSVFAFISKQEFARRVLYHNTAHAVFQNGIVSYKPRIGNATAGKEGNVGVITAQNALGILFLRRNGCRERFAPL